MTAGSRIRVPFQAGVRSKDGRIKFESESVIRDISPRVCYLYLMKRFKTGDKFLIVTPMWNNKPALNGTVSRVEPQSGGQFGTAISIARYRFF